MPEGEGYALAEVVVADSLPQPRGKQPRFGLSILAYLLFDWIGAALMVPLYRRGVRRAHGRQMAPLSSQTRLWSGVLALVGVLGFLLGRGGRRR